MVEKTDKPLILLVDDVPANLHVLAGLLRADYRIKTATRGVIALDLAVKPDKPDLILLDVMMPEMNGLEVLRHLRENLDTRDIPVIFVSADVSEQSQLDGLALGADEYLTKPIVPSVLRVRVRNLLSRKQTEAQLRLAAHVFQYSGEAILITDRNNQIIDANPAFEQMTGYCLDELRGQNPRILASGRANKEEYQAMWWSILEQGMWRGEVWDRRKDGAIYPKLLTISTVRNKRGEVDFFIASFADLSQQKAAEAKILHTAHHDALTGLPNRLHFQINLEQLFATAKRESQEIALMFIDLDRFKIINDTLGHHIGDELLIQVALRLRECVRESDLLARLGGDEFVVALLGGEAVIDTACHVASKVISALSKPYVIEEHQLHSSPSIGISHYPVNSLSIESLLKNADTAMYCAKANGRNNYQIFEPGMEELNRQRLEMGNSLRQALEHHEFVLCYQPQVDYLAGRLMGAEALLRWRHPQKGEILPAQFMPLAEETGLIVQIGQWVIREVCRQVQHWRKLSGASLRYSINLSPRQLRQKDLVDSIFAALSEFDVPATALEFEISELSLMENPTAILPVLQKLSSAGIIITVDDFGTGYSSLRQLRRFPINRLKIHPSFIQHLPDDSDDSAVVMAVIQLGLSLGLSIVAKGVESEAQWQFLHQQGCQLLQGYLHSHPLTVAEFEQLLLRGDHTRS